MGFEANEPTSKPTDRLTLLTDVGIKAIEADERSLPKDTIIVLMLNADTQEGGVGVSRYGEGGTPEFNVPQVIADIMVHLRVLSRSVGMEFVFLPGEGPN
jgi:hypothetical protein